MLNAPAGPADPSFLFIYSILFYLFLEHRASNLAAEPLARQNNGSSDIHRPYSYPQYWTGTTSLQWRLICSSSAIRNGLYMNVYTKYLPCRKCVFVPFTYSSLRTYWILPRLIQKQIWPIICFASSTKHKS